MGFRLVPKSVTLNNIERHNVGQFVAILVSKSARTLYRPDRVHYSPAVSRNSALTYT